MFKYRDMPKSVIEYVNHIPNFCSDHLQISIDKFTDYFRQANPLLIYFRSHSPSSEVPPHTDRHKCRIWFVLKKPTYLI